MSSSTTESTRLSRVLVALAFLWIAGVWFALRPVPFLSEDYTHLSVASAQTSLFQALDPAREPLRPLQHLFFFVVSRSAGAEADVARLVSFALHALACALVFLIARRLGLSPRTAGAAALLFALFPNVKGLAWSAAISTPGRAAFALLAWWCWLRARESGSLAARALSIVAFVVALLFHESAVVVPALIVLWCAFEPASGLAQRARAVGARLREPHVLLIAVSALAYVLYMTFLREQRHHGLKSFDSLPANVVKAALALVPQDLRVLAVEGLRGKLGAGGHAAAASILALVGALVLVVVRRGSRLARFALCVVAIDLALPVLTTGFVQRYAYLSSALVALALAEWALESRGAWRASILALAGFAWLGDSVRDLRAERAAGSIATAALDTACAARAREGPARAIAIVDLPDVWGREDDIPLFNWGLPQALERRGCPGAWQLWRRRDFHTGTDVERIDERTYQAALGGSALVLVAQPPTMELVETRAAGR